jgi:hypothetical protein
MSKEIPNCGLECSAIRYIQEHGEEGWDYAFGEYCDNCSQIEHCNVINGSVEITPKGIKLMEKILASKDPLAEFAKAMSLPVKELENKQKGE